MHILNHYSDVLMLDTVYEQIKTISLEEPCKREVHQHHYTLGFSKKGRSIITWLAITHSTLMILNHKGKRIATIEVSESNVYDPDDSDWSDIFEEGDNKAVISFLEKEAETDLHPQFAAEIRFIKEFELNNVTVEDLTTALDALRVRHNTREEMPDKDVKSDQVEPADLGKKNQATFRCIIA